MRKLFCEHKYIDYCEQSNLFLFAQYFQLSQLKFEGFGSRYSFSNVLLRFSLLWISYHTKNSKIRDLLRFSENSIVSFEQYFEKFEIIATRSEVVDGKRCLFKAILMSIEFFD